MGRFKASSAAIDCWRGRSRCTDLPPARRLPRDRHAGLHDRPLSLNCLRRPDMKRVTGIGGIFFKARDPAALRAWYKRHLGIDVQDWGGAAFNWADADGKPVAGTTAWSISAAASDQFAPSTAPFMVNYRVDGPSRPDQSPEGRRAAPCSTSSTTPSTESSAGSSIRRATRSSSGSRRRPVGRADLRPRTRTCRGRCRRCRPAVSCAGGCWRPP